MDDETSLADRFEAHRPHLRAVAWRMLGSAGDADDAVQETWVRLQRTDVYDVVNLGGWLTTVVARVSLTMLTARRARPEPVAEPVPPVSAPRDGGMDLESAAVLADSVGLALLVVLDTLSPPERLAFVLHDMFAVPFDEIAPIVERSATAARQLASRARRRVQGGDPDPRADLARRREVVDAFLAASRDGDFAALLTVLDPDVVLRADRVTVDAATRAHEAPELAAETYGADAVARVFSGRAAAARPALVDGLPGAAYAPGGRPRAVFRLTVTAGRITGIEVVADPARLGGMDLVLLGS